MYKRRRITGGSSLANPDLAPIPPPKVAEDEGTQIVESNMPVLPGSLEFSSSDYQYVNDNNTTTNQQNSQILIDTLNVQLGPNQCILPSRSFVWIQRYIKVSLGAGAPYAPLGFTWKNGFPDIDSCQVRINNAVVCNNNNQLYLINNYKLATQWSDAKTKMCGSTYLYAPPNMDAGLVQAMASATNILHSKNNCGVPTSAAQAASYIPTAATTYSTGTVAVVAGTATGTGTVWTTAAHVGGILMITSGATAGTYGQITQRNSDTEVVTDNPGLTAAALSTYVILLPPSTTFPFGSSPQLGPPIFNEGLYQRLLDANVPACYSSTTRGATAFPLGAKTFSTAAKAVNLCINSYDFPDTTGAVADTYLMIVNQLIPLEYFSDVFTNRGLCRDRIQLQIGMNDVSSLTGDFSSPTVNLNSTSSCCPIIGTYQGLVQQKITALSTGLKQKARLYLRLVTLPSISPNLPSVIVREYLDYQLLNSLYSGSTAYTADGQQVTFQITQGAQRPRMVLGYFWYTASSTRLVNGLSISPIKQITCEEPACSSPGVYFGGPNMTIQVGTKQAYMNSISNQFEKYFQLDINNFDGANESKTIMVGQSPQMDYRNSQMGNILQVNLAKTTIPLSMLGGMQIYINGSLYAPQNSPVDCTFVLQYSRITQFNNYTKEVKIIAA